MALAAAIYRSAPPRPVDLAASVHPTVLPELVTRRHVAPSSGRNRIIQPARLKEKLDPARALAGPVNITDFVDHVPLIAPEGEPLRLEFDAFVSAIRGESGVVVTGEDGKRALAVALRIVAEIERTRPALTGATMGSA